MISFTGPQLTEMNRPDVKLQWSSHVGGPVDRTLDSILTAVPVVQARIRPERRSADRALYSILTSHRPWGDAGYQTQRPWNEHGPAIGSLIKGKRWHGAPVTLSVRPLMSDNRTPVGDFVQVAEAALDDVWTRAGETAELTLFDPFGALRSSELPTWYHGKTLYHQTPASLVELLLEEAGWAARIDRASFDFWHRTEESEGIILSAFTWGTPYAQGTGQAIFDRDISQVTWGSLIDRATTEGASTVYFDRLGKIKYIRFLPADTTSTVATIQEGRGFYGGKRQRPQGSVLNWIQLRRMQSDGTWTTVETLEDEESREDLGRRSKNLDSYLDNDEGARLIAYQHLNLFQRPPEIYEVQLPLVGMSLELMDLVGLQHSVWGLFPTAAPLLCRVIGNRIDQKRGLCSVVLWASGQRNWAYFDNFDWNATSFVKY